MNMTKKLLSVAILSALTSTAAWADGTLAGTTINNTATISYSVGGVGQTDIGSSSAGNTAGAGSPTSFLVDKKIDLSVTAGSGVNVAPNSVGQAITFEVLNEGNSPETFKFTVKDNVTGDNFDPTNGSCSTPVDILIPPSVLLPAAVPTIITVNCDIPSSVANTQTADVDLKATVVDAAGNPYVESATDTAGVDVVLADDKGSATDVGSETTGAAAGNRNASHSAVNTYTVAGAAANLTVQKTSLVIEDPVNGTLAGGNSPKRIPGATIQYTITVSNAAGATDATDLKITDPVPANMTFVSCSAAGAAVDAANAAVTPTCALNGSNIETSTFTLKGGIPGGTANVETITILATVD